MLCAPKEPSDAPPQKSLSRSCTHDLSHHAPADQGGAGLSSCPGRPCGGRGAPYLRRLCHLPLGEFGSAEMGAALFAGGPPGLTGSPRSGRPPKVTCALEQHLNRLVEQDPLEHGSLHSQWSCRALATVLTQQTGVQLGRESVRCVLKKIH